MSDMESENCTFDPAALPPRCVQDERRNQIGTDGPEYEISSGAFGGVWNSKRGHLASPFLGSPSDD